MREKRRVTMDPTAEDRILRRRIADTLDTVAENLARRMSWSKPVIPAQGDPAPYAGSPALG